MATILIVDDDPELISVLRAILIDEGHTVRTARDGVEALDRLRRAPVLLVIADLMMPAVDGRTLVQEMRRWGDRTPVLLMSGYDQSVDQLPATRFLRKPVALEDILAAVEWAASLAGHSLRSQAT